MARVAVMRIAVSIVLALHGLICVMGFAKAFSLAELQQLQLPISRPMGALWLVSALPLIASAVAFATSASWCWAVALAGAALSQIAIISSWSDARFGTLGNLLAVLASLYAAFAWGPFGLRAEFARRSTQAASALPAARLVSEQDLAPLPPQVQRYLRYVGVVGRAMPRLFRVRFNGRIRGSASDPWMQFNGEQLSLVCPATRLFVMRASRSGVPFDALHVYDQNAARMRVKLLSLFSMVDASGVEFSRTETVTIFNDLCIMAPAALIDPSIQWRSIDDRSVEATFTNGPHTIRATLVFDGDGALSNFISDDRPALAADNKTFTPQRWSTPIGAYRSMAGVRLASRGEARYHPQSGEYAYIEFSDLSVSYE